MSMRGVGRGLRAALLAVCAVALALGMGEAGAQAYPDKPVSYVLGFAPGGESDLAARFQQKAFQKKYGKDMIISYKAGAGGGLAWAQLNTLPGDGYNITGVNLPHIVLQPLEGNVQYKTEDLVAVYYFHYTADAIVVSSDSPFKTLRDLIEYAKAHPGEITLAGSGTNSANHVAHEKLNQMMGIKTTYVPFKGTGDLVASLLGGHVKGAMSYLTLASLQKGKTRVLAVGAEKRSPVFPDVPTFRELGYDWVDGAYRGVAVPKSTPEATRKQVSEMIGQLNNDPELRKAMIDGGFEMLDMPYDKIPAFMQERTREYMVIAKRLGLVK